MKYISVEDFMSQPKEIQQIFLDWWQPEEFDICADRRLEKHSVTQSDLGDIYNYYLNTGSISRVGYELFYYLFKKYNCEIVVMSEVGSIKLDSEEIFEEIVSLLHCYSMKLYSKRKGQKIKEILKE